MLLQCFKNKRFVILVSCLLALCFLAALVKPASETLADEGQSTYRYMEDLKVYEGVTLDEARKLAKENGYILFEQNLNEGAKKGTYLAYKPTSDEKKGLTDISMLEMGVDYSMANFQDLVNAQVRQLRPKAEIMNRASLEFAEKYKAGSPAAIYACQLLDMLFVDEFGITLGQAILAGKTNADFFNKVLVRATAGFSSAITHALTTGITDLPEDNWASRVSQTKTRDLSGGKYDNQKYDEQYQQLADDAVRTVQAFAACYQNAAAREFANGQISEKDVSACTSAGDVAGIISEDNESIEESDGDIAYIAAYKALNQYHYDEETLLGDYLIEAGARTYATTADLRFLYPLIEAMTPVQAEMLSVSDLVLFALYLENSEELLSSSTKEIKEMNGLINQYNVEAGAYLNTVSEEEYDEIVSNRKNAISIWAGVNQAIYEQEVALTSEAIRYNTAGSNYTAYTTDNSLSAFLDKIEVYFNIVQYSGGLIVAVAHLIAYYAGYYSLYAAAGAAWAAGGAYACLGVACMACFILEIILLVALLIWLVVELIGWIIDQFSSEADDEEYSEIPGKIFDVKDITYDGELHTGYVMYNAVTNQNGKFADLNAGNGKRWNALYYTDSTEYGSAIRVSDMEEMFRVEYGSYQTMEGYSAVQTLGNQDIANLNANTNRTPLYLFFRNRSPVSNTPVNEGTSEKETAKETEKQPETENPVKPEEQGSKEEGTAQEETKDPEKTKEQEEKKEPEKTQYLEMIKLYTESNETAAKARFKKEVNRGYHLIDYNLANGVKKKYTYLAYKLTTNPKNALTDIRVCNAYAPPENAASNSLQVGEGSYGLAGNLYNGSSLWVTSSPNAGTPIVGSPEILESMAKAKEGWEPVNLTSGGPAYDFNQGEVVDQKGLKEKANYGKHVYIYFNPSVHYTSGTEYVGGIAFFKEQIGYKVDQVLYPFLEETGYKLFNHTNFGTSFIRDKQITHMRSYLAYTPTYNPYRAIYDVKYYIGTYTMNQLPPAVATMIDGKSVAYNPVSTYICEKNTGRTMDNTNAFLDFCNGSLYGSIRIRYYNEQKNPPWEVARQQPYGLFVKTYTGGDEKPLVPEDLYVSSQQDPPNGYAPIRNLLNRYEAKVVNFGASRWIYNFPVLKQDSVDGAKRDYAYIYTRKSIPEKPRYISAVHVSSFVMPDYPDLQVREHYEELSEDNARISALASAGAEVIDVNIALKEGSRWNKRTGKIKKKEEYNENTKQRTVTYYSSATSSGSSHASYISVDRTNNAAEAIRGLLKYKPSNPKEAKDPPNNITVGKAKYILAGSKISGVDGDYYLYYTTNKGVSPCEPIMDITVDGEIFVNSSSTALIATAQDSEENLAIKTSEADNKVFLHCRFNDEGHNAISKFFIGSGNTEREAMADLAAQGCCAMVHMDLNNTAGGRKIYLGYEKYHVNEIRREDYSSTSKYNRALKTEYSDAVKDLVLTSGEPLKDSLELNGITYKPVAKVNLNEGAFFGKELYLYYTRDMSLGKSMIINRVGMAMFERIPQNTDQMMWERLLTTEGRCANLNEGVISFEDGDKKHITENALHMFVHRLDNTVKKGAEITGGFTEESRTYGTMKIRRN